MELKCKKCGGEIQHRECVDVEVSNSGKDAVICTFDGYCHKCKTEYTWTEEYRYHHREELKIFEI